MACKIIKFTDGSYISVLYSDTLSIGAYDYTVNNAAIACKVNGRIVSAWPANVMKTDLDGNSWRLNYGSNWADLILNGRVVCSIGASDYNACMLLRLFDNGTTIYISTWYPFPHSDYYNDVYWYGQYLFDIDSLTAAIRDKYNSYSNFYGCNLFQGADNNFHLVVSCKNSDTTYGFRTTNFSAHYGGGERVSLSTFQNSYKDVPAAVPVQIPVQWDSTKYGKLYQDSCEINVSQ